MALPEADRASLASELLHSVPAEVDEADPTQGLTTQEIDLIDTLPGVLRCKDDEEEFAEARRRDAEMDADPSICLTWEEFDGMIRQRVPYASEP